MLALDKVNDEISSVYGIFPRLNSVINDSVNFQ